MAIPQHGPQNELTKLYNHGHKASSIDSYLLFIILFIIYFIFMLCPQLASAKYIDTSIKFIIIKYQNGLHKQIIATPKLTHIRSKSDI